MRHTLATALVATLLSACAVKVAEAPPEGRLEVFTPRGVFDVDALEESWIVIGSAGTAAERTSIVTLEGVPTLRIDGDKDAFALVRRTKAMLLATPFLSWSWQMQDAGARTHPLRLVIGFHGGRPDSRSWGSEPFVWTGSTLPPHDRVLSLVWGASALQRGSFLPPKKDTDGDVIKGLPRYVVRGGTDNANAWKLDTVDLSRLYARTWPGDTVKRTQIMFIGFSYQPDDPAFTPRGYLSGLLLSR